MLLIEYITQMDSISFTRSHMATCGRWRNATKVRAQEKKKEMILVNIQQAFLLWSSKFILATTFLRTKTICKNQSNPSLT